MQGRCEPLFLNPQPNPQIAMSYMTFANFGSLRVHVSRCKTIIHSTLSRQRPRVRVPSTPPVPFSSEGIGYILSSPIGLRFFTAIPYEPSNPIGWKQYRCLLSVSRCRSRTTERSLCLNSSPRRSEL